MTNRGPNVEAALGYAERGWPVLPLHWPNGDRRCSCGKAACASAAKHPRTAHGLKDASTVQEVVERWWSEWPNANIGIRTGAEAGIIVLDVDPRDGGDDSLAALEREHGELPPTVEAITGHGGRHLIFVHPGGHVRNRAGVRPGIDVRADGGYIVAAPSIHVSGRAYQWLNERSPVDIDPARAPDWLLHLITVPTAREQYPMNYSCADSIDGDDRVASTVQAMMRMRMNDSNDGSKRLFAAACRCVEHDLSDAEATRAIRAYADRRPFRRGWSDDEILKRIRDAEGECTRSAALRKNGRSTAGDRSASPGRRGQSQATKLVRLAENAYLFHSPNGEPYASVINGTHRENWPVRSRGLRLWMRRLFYEEHHRAPNAQAMTDALGVLEGRALFDGGEESVALRIAGHEGAVYLDLSDSEWTAIEVTAQGWRILSSESVPVRFIRRRGMLALPTPARGGHVDELRPLVNVPDDDSWVLLMSWLAVALQPAGPYPVMLVNGEQGSAKSTLCRMLRALIDPNEAPLRAEPREPRDLMIGAANGWVLTFDNLSRVQPWLSDALCRLATGGGFATRKLYTDDEEVIFDAMRPVLVNGIDDVATRPDLLDRAVKLTLPTIPDSDRQQEATIWRNFEAARPRLLGALLDAVAVGLRRFHDVYLDRLPRMADFAVRSVASETAFGFPPGAFMSAYAENRETRPRRRSKRRR